GVRRGARPARRAVRARRIHASYLRRCSGHERRPAGLAPAGVLARAGHVVAAGRDVPHPVQRTGGRSPNPEGPCGPGWRGRRDDGRHNLGTVPSVARDPGSPRGHLDRPAVRERGSRVLGFWGSKVLFGSWFVVRGSGFAVRVLALGLFLRYWSRTGEPEPKNPNRRTLNLRTVEP